MECCVFFNEEVNDGMSKSYEMRVNDITVIKDFDTKTPLLMADEYQLQQVFMNIIINAEQAFLESGKKGCGTTFTVELPLNGSHCVRPEEKREQTEVRKNVGIKKVLVVDDEVSVVDLVRIALEREGYIVETAHNGDSAIRMIEEDVFDAVISDLKMPGKSGIDLYLACGEKRPELSERFLMLTGDVAAPESQSFMAAHSILHLSKPFDIKTLVSSVHLLFRED